MSLWLLTAANKGVDREASSAQRLASLLPGTAALSYQRALACNHSTAVLAAQVPVTPPHLEP